MPNPRVAHCVFCDDIRGEIGNKFSMMGVYTNDLIIYGTLPSVLPTFAIVAWLICDVGDAPSEMTLRLVGPTPVNDGLIAKGEFKNIVAKPAPDAHKIQIRVVLQLAGLPFTEEGNLDVYIDTADGTLRAGRLKVKAQPHPVVAAPQAETTTSPNEPSPPSPQSPDAAPEKETKPEPSRPSRRRVSPKRPR